MAPCQTTFPHGWGSESVPSIRSWENLRLSLSGRLRNRPPRAAPHGRAAPTGSLPNPCQRECQRTYRLQPPFCGDDLLAIHLQCMRETLAKKRVRQQRAAARGGRSGAGNGVRTRDIQLGKLTLYQLSYARIADQQYNQSAARRQSAGRPGRRHGRVLSGGERPRTRGPGSRVWTSDPSFSPPPAAGAAARRGAEGGSSRTGGR
jgi:hypothetical protein